MSKFDYSSVKRACGGRAKAKAFAEGGQPRDLNPVVDAGSPESSQDQELLRSDLAQYGADRKRGGKVKR